MAEIENVCVYCGSGAGNDPCYADAAAVLGRALAAEGIGLVYGGGNIGLMGVVARATLEHGGRVVGIIPDFLKTRERMLEAVQETIVVPDMHTRKRLMFERADAFVALPGGIGTLEELIEQLTWAQLGRHQKPILLLSVNRFWEPLLTLFAHMHDYGFLRPGLELNYLVTEQAQEVVPMLRQAARPAEAADRAAADLIESRF